jgi:hypothetical protein
MNDWFHRGEYVVHPFGHGERGKVYTRKERRKLEAEKSRSRKKERDLRGSDAVVGLEEVDIRGGVSSPEWRRRFTEAMALDEPYEDYPHLVALREQYIRQLLNRYQREGVPRE